jgi:hypothetical protein
MLATLAQASQGGQLGFWLVVIALFVIALFAVNRLDRRGGRLPGTP